MRCDSRYAKLISHGGGSRLKNARTWLVGRRGEAFPLALLIGKHRVSNPAHLIFGRGVGAVCRH